jgi:molybdopterin synthase sulfur carrier subunit
MSVVRIPSVLRPETAGQREVEVEGSTVGGAVQALVEQHPGLQGRLFTPEGELHRFVNVYLNGRDVRYLDGLDTPVGERDEIRLLPAIAGGATAVPDADDTAPDAGG